MRPVFQKLIVGYDGSDQADDALAFARMLAGALGAGLTLVEVMPYEPLLSEISIGPPTTLAAQRESTREGLERLAGSLDVEAEAVESRSPSRGLHEAAERLTPISSLSDPLTEALWDVSSPEVWAEASSPAPPARSLSPPGATAAIRTTCRAR